MSEQFETRNGLLRALTPEQLALFRPNLKWIDLPVRHVLVEAEQPTSHVCFLEEGLASVVAFSPDEESIEIGHIGREGMTGGHIALAAGQTTTRTFMQVAGSGLTMPADVFTAMLDAART